MIGEYQTVKKNDNYHHAMSVHDFMYTYQVSSVGPLGPLVKHIEI